ncbi:response regulator [uncultured Ferrovibrio sp.]|uniref:response regulator n=1 Tax=uncultured Ferrovibrio sp. TaxID=1576913 RepID=UPI00261FBEEF|nr:response regulator [uncultured Ferrovibrio sp.]
MANQDKKLVYEKVRILVIEDERHTRQIVCGMLRQLGFEKVDEAADGEAGFNELLRTRPSVVLCDIHMEPMGGLDFLAKLRALANPSIAETPVIFLTADHHQETVLEAKKTGADAYLAKPVSPAMLQQRLDVILRKLGFL